MVNKRLAAISLGGLALVISLLAIPAVSQAQYGGDYGLSETAQQTSLPQGTNLIRTVATVINTLLGVLGVVLVALVIYAGFLWMTAAGNEEQVKKARTLLRNAVIGLVIVFAAYALSAFIITTLNKAAR